MKAVVPCGALRASSSPRYKARKDAPLLRTSSRTKRPRFPDAPVSRIMIFPPSKRLNFPQAKGLRVVDSGRIVQAGADVRKYAQLCKCLAQETRQGKDDGMKDHHGCPVQATINLLSGKWKVQILWHLSFQPLRFAELRKKLKDISEKILTEQLRLLEESGLIHREATSSIPPAVTYSLTPEAGSLIPLLENLCDWGCVHFEMTPSLPRPKETAHEHTRSRSTV